MKAGIAVRLGSLVVCATAASAQTTFTPIATPPPGFGFSNGYTERFMFGDLDGDGDLDAVLADGGDFGNQRNRVWINLGGIQAGTIGTFADESSTRWPSVSDNSRDVELVDIDRDGDLDAYVSNTSGLTFQSNRWFVNMGGAQGGTPGFFQDDTAARWVGLAQGAGPGHPYASSISPGLVGSLFPPDGFKDWSCECGFGDVDNDGDMDLLHGSYGDGFNGMVPTRIFLNDGTGHFFEFNPSGFQLPSETIANGSPALWAEGIQQDGTTNTTGQFADIATHALTAMFADLDNDLDLDVFLGSRNTQPRAFFNRLTETGTLAFRDVTSFVYTVNAVGTGHYEQNLADLDNDGDLDAYLLNYGISPMSFVDRVAQNDGTGRFVNFQDIPSSDLDFHEVDFIDLENDGDLDAVLATRIATERAYVNTLVPNGTLSFTPMAGFPNLAGASLDVDVADFDNDGDYDLGYAMDSNVSEKLLANDLVQTGGPVDGWAPRLKRLEQAPNRAVGSAPTVVRTQVYDNAPLYVVGQQNMTRLFVTVNGCPMPEIPMGHSGGQIFRGEIPGGFVGTVHYTALSTDEHGNTGTSTTLAGAPEVLFYVATGNKAALPYGSGTAGTAGLVPFLDVTGPAAAGNPAFALCVSNGLPAGAGFLLFATAPLLPGVSFGGVVGNVNPLSVFLTLPITLDANGRKALLVSLSPAIPPSATTFVQYAGIDPGAPVGISSSNGLAVTTTPPLP